MKTWILRVMGPQGTLQKALRLHKHTCVRSVSESEDDELAAASTPSDTQHNKWPQRQMMNSLLLLHIHSMTSGLRDRWWTHCCCFIYTIRYTAQQVASERDDELTAAASSTQHDKWPQRQMMNSLLLLHLHHQIPSMTSGLRDRWWTHCCCFIYTAWQVASETDDELTAADHLHHRIHSTTSGLRDRWWTHCCWSSTPSDTQHNKWPQRERWWTHCCCFIYTIGYTAQQVASETDDELTAAASSTPSDTQHNKWPQRQMMNSLLLLHLHHRIHSMTSWYVPCSNPIPGIILITTINLPSNRYQVHYSLVLTQGSSTHITLTTDKNIYIYLFKQQHTNSTSDHCC